MGGYILVRRAVKSEPGQRRQAPKSPYTGANRFRFKGYFFSAPLGSTPASIWAGLQHTRASAPKGWLCVGGACVAPVDVLPCAHGVLGRSKFLLLAEPSFAVLAECAAAWAKCVAGGWGAPKAREQRVRRPAGGGLRTGFKSFKRVLAGKIV